MKFMKFALLFALPFSASYASATKLTFPAQVRLFVGTTSASPVDVNTQLSADGIKKIDHVTKYGIEISYPLLRFLNVGIRYTLRYDHEDENNLSTNGYYGEIDQNEGMAIARIPFIKTKFIRLDAFGGFGGTNTTLKLKGGGQDGELTKKAATGWFASPSYSYGASLAVGWKSFFVTFEGGYDSNDVKGGFKTDGVNANINSIDLSGSYFMLGLMFDGMPVTRE